MPAQDIELSESALATPTSFATSSVPPAPLTIFGLLHHSNASQLTQKEIPCISQTTCLSTSNKRSRTRSFDDSCIDSKWSPSQKWRQPISKHFFPCKQFAPSGLSRCRSESQAPPTQEQTLLSHSSSTASETAELDSPLFHSLSAITTPASSSTASCSSPSQFSSSSPRKNTLTRERLSNLQIDTNCAKEYRLTINRFAISSLCVEPTEVGSSSHSDDQLHDRCLSDFRLLWSWLGLILARPQYHDSKLPYYAANVFLWLFSASVFYNHGSSLAFDLGGNTIDAPTDTTVGVSTADNLMCVFLAPIAHLVLLEFFFHRSMLRSLFRAAYVDRKTPSPSRTPAITATSATSCFPTRSTCGSGEQLFEADASFVQTILFFAMGYSVLNVGLLISSEPQPFSAKLLVVIMCLWCTSICWVSLALFGLVCRILWRHLASYMERVQHRRFATAEDLFNFHLSLRVTFANITKYLRLYSSTLCAVIAVLFSVFFKRAWIGEPIVLGDVTLLWIFSSIKHFLCLIFTLWLLTTSVTSINDFHQQLKKCILANKLFTEHERLDLIAEIESFPILFPLAGLTFYSSTFKRSIIAVTLLFALALAKASLVESPSFAFV